MDNESDKQQKRKHPYLALIILSVVVIGVQLVFGISIYTSHQQWTERGQFGDMFGAVNTLFFSPALLLRAFSNYPELCEIRGTRNITPKLELSVAAQVVRQRVNVSGSRLVCFVE